MTVADDQQTDAVEQTVIDIQTVRSRVVDRVLIYFAVVIPLALAMSLSRITEHGWHPIYILHMGVTVLLVGGALLHKRLPYRVRVFLLLGTLVTLGGMGLAIFGLLGGGHLGLVFSPSWLPWRWGCGRGWWRARSDWW